MDTEKNESRPESRTDEERKKRRRRNGRKPQPQSAQNRPEGDRRPPREGNREGGRDGNRYNAKWGLEDVYGKPTEEDSLSLEELRARIVLKAADGSKPTVHEPETENPPAPETDAQAVPASATPADEALPGSDLYPMPEDPAEAGADEPRVEVVGIRFRASGKVYYFDPKGNRVSAGDCAIVETVRGSEFGEVSFGNRMIRKSDATTPLRPMLRVATEEDIARNEENRAKEQEALRYCQERVTARGLEMKLIDAQYAFDNSKLLIYFSSEGRVDFRDLVKDLAAAFHTRIELRQIGIRDEAKMLGGLGACGRPLCCSTFLNDFGQVSIKMAKEQNLSLNSLKISGICGRLMCCLRYEAETYAAEAKLTPPVRSTVKTADGIGTVVSSVPLAGTVKVALNDAPDAEPKTYSRDEVVLLAKREKAPAQNTEANQQPRKKPQKDKKPR